MKTSGMSMLLREGQLSAEEWIAFLELIRQELNPYLDKFTLKRFGDLACIHSEEDNQFYHSLFEDAPDVSGMDLVGTHGIMYFNDSGRCRRVGDTRTQYAWGLTKHGEWVVMKINIVLDPSQQVGLTARKKPFTRERATEVSLLPTPFTEMLGTAHIRPRDVWQTICMEVENWRCKRLLSYEAALKLSSEFKVLDSMFNGLLIKTLPPEPAAI